MNTFFHWNHLNPNRVLGNICQKTYPRFQRIPLNQCGFSLISVLVFGVLVGVLNLVLLTLFKGHFRATRTVTSMSDTNNMDREIQLVLSHNSYCQNAFKDGSGNNITFTAGLTSNVSKIQLGNTVIVPPNNINTFSITSINIDQVPGSPGIPVDSSKTQYAVELKVVGQRKIKQGPDPGNWDFTKKYNFSLTADNLTHAISACSALPGIHYGSVTWGNTSDVSYSLSQECANPTNQPWGCEEKLSSSYVFTPLSQRIWVTVSLGPAWNTAGSKSRVFRVWAHIKRSGETTDLFVPQIDSMWTSFDGWQGASHQYLFVLDVVPLVSHEISLGIRVRCVTCSPPPDPCTPCTSINPSGFSIYSSPPIVIQEY